MKRIILNHLKNIVGWRTKRKIVVISVDDYGNVRLDSKKARIALDQKGLKILSRFDSYDTLETREDLEMLYEVLTSVKDKNNRSAVFTAFALPCNIDFDKLSEEKFNEYHFELLPKTYEKLATQQATAYSGTWNMWKEGIEKKIIVPQFHGREHLNVRVFNEMLERKDPELLACVENRSYTSISNTGYPTIEFVSAFQFWKFEENDEFKGILKDGMEAFANVFGKRATHFNAPGDREHPIIHETLKEGGIKYLDSTLAYKMHLGIGKFKRAYNYTGNKNGLDMIFQVRNILFEPTEEKGIDWVNFSLKQIETAFLWNRPAIISSHRVNFCGHIDPKNRDIGLGQLKELLKKIVQKWPEVEFMSADELGDLIMNERKRG